MTPDPAGVPFRGFKRELERVEDAHDELVRLDAVTDVRIHEDRRPIRLSVTLADGRIPAAVHDRLDEYGGIIEDASITDGQLSLTIYLEGAWHAKETNPIRPHGGSLVVTLPREALDDAEIGNGDDVTISSRYGELLLRRD